MKHAGAAALDRIEPLLKRLRALEGLKEKTRGCFYLSSRAFLHFHEHGKDELYADIGAGDFERLPAVTATQQKIVFERAAKAVAEARPQGKKR